jgi:ArsR family transcriptional regulator, lead/cadmium/zinc/bismuth-responsive transcriptional repressor
MTNKTKMTGMNSNMTCIRDGADIEQIRDCKTVLQEKAFEIADLAAALNLAGNEVRLKILYVVRKEEALCVCDLSDILGISIAAVSQHLRKLKDGNLLQKQRVGQTIFYSINMSKMNVLGPLFAHIEETTLVN